MDPSISLNVLSSSARTLLSEKVKDQTALKIKEYFLRFLEKFDDSPLTDQVTSNVRNSANPPNASSQNTFLSSTINLPSSLAISSELSSSLGELPGTAGTSQILPTYIRQLEIMKNDSKTTLFVNFSHLMLYNDVLARAIMEGYHR